jgi:subtilisin family serine protease
MGPIATLTIGILCIGSLCGLGANYAHAQEAKEEETASWAELRHRAENTSIIWANSGEDFTTLRQELVKAGPEQFVAADSLGEFNAFVLNVSPEEAVRLIEQRNLSKHVQSITPNSIIYGFGANCDDEDILAPISTTDIVPLGVMRVFGANPTDYTGGKRAWILDSGIATDTGIRTDLNVNSMLSVKCFAAGACTQDSDTDRIGHGTMIAGIIGARTATAGGGFRGVAPGAELISIKIFNRKIKASTAEVALKGLEYLAPKIVTGDVINISWGMYFNPLPLSPGVDSVELQLEAKLKELASAKGVWIVIAAGNTDSIQGSGYVQTISPARAGSYRPASGGIMTVSAVHSRMISSNWIDNFWRFSAFGNGRVLDPQTDDQPGPPEFAAPGVDIQSYWPGDKVNVCSGTSFAAAHVTGLMLYGTLPKNGGPARWDPSAIKPGKELPGILSDYYTNLSDPIAVK